MEPYQRQQFDFLLYTAVDRFSERLIQRNAGVEHALARLRDDPQGEGVWLDEFVRALFNDFLLDNAAGACFVLQALQKRSVAAPAPGTIDAQLREMAARAFADLLARKTAEAMEQQSGYA